MSEDECARLSAERFEAQNNEHHLYDTRMMRGTVYSDFEVDDFLALLNNRGNGIGTEPRFESREGPDGRRLVRATFPSTQSLRDWLHPPPRPAPPRGERRALWSMDTDFDEEEVLEVFRYFKVHGNFFPADDIAKASEMSRHECRSAASPCFVDDHAGIEVRSSGCNWFHVLLWRYGGSDEAEEKEEKEENAPEDSAGDDSQDTQEYEHTLGEPMSESEDTIAYGAEELAELGDYQRHLSMAEHESEELQTIPAARPDTNV